jgi:hypothetical protein
MTNPAEAFVNSEDHKAEFEDHKQEESMEHSKKSSAKQGVGIRRSETDKKIVETD